MSGPGVPFPPPPGSAPRICVVLLTGLGDVVLGLPVVNALKSHDPGTHVTWVVEPMPSDVLRHHPAVDEVVVYHKKRGVAGVRELWRRLGRRRFDATLNLNIYFKSIWPTLGSRAPHRVGFGPDRARDGVWLAANHRLPPRSRRHTLEMFMEFPRYLGVEDPRVEYRLEPTAEERRAAEEFFEPLRDRPVVALVPASAHALKDWPPEKYARVADVLAHDLGFRTVLVGGPGARETALARRIVERASAPPVWAMGDGVRRLLWLLDGSDLVIAPDTGPLHMAAAMKVPVIGLYGHTNPWRVGPYRRFEDLWVDGYTDPDDVPDPSLAEPRDDGMDRVTVDAVLERVERARQRYLRTPAD